MPTEAPLSPSARAKIEAEAIKRGIPIRRTATTVNRWRNPLNYKPRGGALELWESRNHEQMIAGPAETGKAQPLDSLVCTPFGFVPMGELKVGDAVCTPDGDIAMVKAIYPQGEQEVFRLTFTCGSRAECTADHLWKFEWLGGGKRNGNHVRRMSAVLPLNSIFADYLIGNTGRPKYSIPQAEPVWMASRKVPIPAYTLGVFLGDGHIGIQFVSLSTKDGEVLTAVEEELGPDYRFKYLGNCDYALRWNGSGIPKRRAAKRGYIYNGWKGRYNACARKAGSGVRYLGTFLTREEAQAAIDANTEPTHNADELPRGIWNDFAELGLEGKHSYDKFVPAIYKTNSAEVRLAVLQGLMDTDATVDKKTGQPVFTSTSRRLAEDVRELVESLGGMASIREKQTKCRTALNVFIRIADPASLFRLERKKELARRSKPVRRMLLKIEAIGKKQCQCISVDTPDGLYLTDSFIVTHNTFGALHKLNSLLWEYPGAQAVACRKQQVDIYPTFLQTFRRIVNLHPEKYRPTYYGGENKPEWVDYKNGSRLWFAGLDKPGKALSSERDYIYINQAEECNVEDWETLTTRCTGRAGNTDEPMLIGDCNPGPPNHWIRLRQAIHFIESRHEDNPILFDENGVITARGRQTLAILDELTGVRYQRLRLGKWVAAEGQVYEEWDRSYHLIDRFEIPADWRRFRVIDFGFRNPASVGWYAVSPDGELIRYRAIYETGRLVEDLAREILSLSAGERIEATVCDHDAEDRATLERHGVPTTAADKRIQVGIETVQVRLKKQPNGRRPRLAIFKDSLVKRDESLVEARKPHCAEDEFESYVYPKGVDGKPLKEIPVDIDNHGMDEIRYACMYADKPLKRKARGAYGN